MRPLDPGSPCKDFPGAQAVPPRGQQQQWPAQTQRHSGWRPRRGRAGQGVPAWGSRTRLLPRARCRLLLSLCLPEGGKQADNGPHSPASRPWPLELGRQLPAKAAASTGPSRSPRPACWVALITWYVPGAHMPTLCSGEGTGGLRWMGLVESKASCSSPTPKEGPEWVLYTPWGIFHPQRDLSFIFQSPISQLLLSSWTEGVGVGEKEEVDIFVTSSQILIILLALHYTYLIHGETEAQRGCVIYLLPHSWKGQSGFEPRQAESRPNHSPTEREWDWAINVHPPTPRERCARGLTDMDPRLGTSCSESSEVPLWAMFSCLKTSTVMRGSAVASASHGEGAAAVT